MKERLVIAAVLIATVYLRIFYMTTAFADINNAPVNSRDTSQTDTEINNNQHMVISGVNVRAQNSAENNIDAQITSGDEGINCHNIQNEV